jgi:hypothetical protein
MSELVGEGVRERVSNRLETLKQCGKLSDSTHMCTFNKCLTQTSPERVSRVQRADLMRRAHQPQGQNVLQQQRVFNDL